jgi:DNA-binding NtrC family response regulator
LPHPAVDWILTSIERLNMDTQPTVLIVEDESELRGLVAESLVAVGFNVAQASDAAEALGLLEGFAYDAVVLDLQLPDGDGLDILAAARARYPDIRSVVLTGSGGIPEAVTAMRRGAVDFFTKPCSLTKLAVCVLDSIRRREEGSGPTSPTTQPRFRCDSIIGQSPAMTHVLQRLELVAPLTSTVLLLGETGTGKELVARTIHENSPRRKQPFVAFSAGAIPDGLIEAELFGHVKGAFTGAIATRMGRFEMAHRGTLFIDEVATMPLALQAKLLRALQEREFERVGESKPIQTDVRVIAASNVDLRTLVKQGSFREDLFYRLSVVPIQLPPLRSRRGDIPLLAQHFVRKSCTANTIPLRTIPQTTIRHLMGHAWAGNIRELENAIEHAVAMSGSEMQILPDMLPEELRRSDRSDVIVPVTIPDEGINFTSVVSQVERELILRSLEKTGGNKRQAARLLNLSRTTLIDKLQRLGGLRAETIA